jgi:hypothetical protein
MIDYAIVLTYHPDYLGRLWGMTDNDYTTLVMHDNGPKPTKAALESRFETVALELESKLIEAKRRARYQIETDGLYFEAMRGDGDLTAWKAAVQKVRADLPKPGAAK